MNPRFNISPTSSPAPKSCDAADANLNWEWLSNVLKPLGFTVVVVEANLNANQHGWPMVGEVIGVKLQEAKLGEFESEKSGDKTLWFFYVPTSRAAAAVRLIQSELRLLTLLDQVKIGLADIDARLWRTFHPEIEGK